MEGEFCEILMDVPFLQEVNLFFNKYIHSSEWTTDCFDMGSLCSWEGNKKPISLDQECLL